MRCTNGSTHKVDRPVPVVKWYVVPERGHLPLVREEEPEVEGALRALHAVSFHGRCNWLCSEGTGKLPSAHPLLNPKAAVRCVSHYYWHKVCRAVRGCARR